MSPSSATLAPPAEALDGLVEGLKQAWRAGQAPPDAAGACRAHPALAEHRSLFVDLAYEDYCLLEEAGTAPDVEDFCRALPAFRSQIREVLRGHRMIADHPDLFAAGKVEWPKPGDTVERLHLSRELGRGAFARVYLATDPDAGNREVALKLAPTPSGEAGTLGPIRHPHIGGIHWARPTAGNLYALCMPFVGAATLADAIEAAFRRGRPAASARAILAAAGEDPVAPVVSGRMTYPRAVAAIGARLADALAHLHRTGVAHGDLKPSNVLLGTGAHPYLIDFNLANGPAAALLRCGGTLPYMAPERVRLMIGRPAGGADPLPADVYSFGALLFEVLTGRVPVEPLASPDLAAVAADLVTRTPPPVRACAPTVPWALARLVDWCLAAEPGRRPTAEELKRRLARLARRSVVPAAVGAVLLVGGGFGAVLAALPAPVAAVVEAEPRTPDEFVARGRKHLAAGELDRAESRFLTAQRGGPHPAAAAHLAYCFALSGRHPAAADLYQIALKADFNPPWVHNDLAYSLLHKGKVYLNLADVHASLAIEALEATGADARPAYYNRARVRAQFQLDSNRQTYRLADPRCRDDLAKALPAGPVTDDQLVLSALILAAAGPGDRTNDILTYLERAIDLGHPPANLLADPVLASHLKGMDRFDHLDRRAGVKTVPPPAYGLISPLD